MERIRQMSLKKAFFSLTLPFLLIAFFLSALSVWGIGELMGTYGTSIRIEDGTGVTVAPALEPAVPPSWYRVLSLLQLLFPTLFVLTAILAADLLFYRLKLKRPLAILQSGAERIMRHDLDFTMPSGSKDELGQLCDAFEAMRQELANNNKKLWRQMEQRKRLNAAFSHNLRNPVTVVKGSAKMLKKGLSTGALSSHQAQDAISLIEEYAGRIESYVEAMSSVQRLEQLSCAPRLTDWGEVAKEMKESIRLLTQDAGYIVESRFEHHRQSVWIDKSYLFNVAENLIANAGRYAKKRIEVEATVWQDELIFSVRDDGGGYSQAILDKGAQPFLRGEGGAEPSVHFGMGLYVCKLLCEKHGGSLTLWNEEAGAFAEARFRISKP
ncbi:Signal transduction histidine kinase [Fontibacillus panacisegetis]|uniref:histidine kinase n=1 Tax=Fontibacillus panacisegetis TaxID=670482 RepID=A0A1G7LC12_9BACL|nr:HAMP domain-containing sensor histidine kinase [Fontibacillus panacisegetis]SDF47057.1 Signal transduction histidine kinase [Fontibacillus panacisegetis]